MTNDFMREEKFNFFSAFIYIQKNIGWDTMNLVDLSRPVQTV